MSDNILVIGNGFDLAHGRKTKYSDFMEWICQPSDDFKKNHPDLLFSNRFPAYKNSSLMTYLIYCFENNQKIKGWIDLEQELKTFIHYIDELIDYLNEQYYNTTDSAYKIGSRSVNITYAILINQLVSIFNIKSFEADIKNEYINTLWKIDKQKIFEKIRSELMELRSAFEFYLIHVEPLLHNQIERIDIISKIDPLYVISFNYTDTIQKVYGVQPENICYIHGKINEKNIVLGYDDSDGSTEDLDFKKYYQRLIYETDKIKYIKFQSSDGYGGLINHTIYFFGHSLDVSDKDILSSLFSRNNPVKIYYRDNEDKSTKIKNIIKILGKQKANQKLLSNSISFFTE